MKRFFKITFLIAVIIMQFSSLAIEDSSKIEKTSGLSAKINFDDVLKKAKDHAYDLKLQIITY